MDSSSELGYYYPLDPDVDASSSSSSSLKHHQVRYEELKEKYEKCEEECKTTSLKLQESEEENKKLKSEAKKTKSDWWCTDIEYVSLVRELKDENKEYDAEIRELGGKMYELKKESEMREEISIGKVIRGLCICLDHVVYSQIMQFFSRDDDEFQSIYEELVEKYQQCEEKLKKTTLKLQDYEKENKKLKSEARKEKIRQYCGVLKCTFQDYDAEIRELEGKIYELEKESEMLELSKGSSSYTQVIRGLCLTLDHVVRRRQNLFSSSGYKLLLD